jgi:nucleoside-diphosphate-sugar epimerase
MESHVDTTRLRTLGWSPATTLEEGLQRTIAVERSRLAACAF